MTHPLFFVPQISQIPTDFLLFKSHADFADDADFFYFFTFKSSHTDLTNLTDFLLFQSPTDFTHTDFFFYFLPFKVTQIAQMTQIFYLFTFLPFKSSPSGPIPQNMARERSKLSPDAIKPEASCPQAVPARKIWRGL